MKRTTSTKTAWITVVLSASVLCGSLVSCGPRYGGKVQSDPTPKPQPQPQPKPK